MKKIKSKNYIKMKKKSQDYNSFPSNIENEGQDSSSLKKKEKKKIYQRGIEITDWEEV